MRGGKEGKNKRKKTHKTQTAPQDKKEETPTRKEKI